MSGETRQKNGESKDNKKLLIIIIIILAVLLVAGAIVLAFFLGKRSSQNPAGTESTETDKREVAGSVRQVLDEESASNVYEEMRQEVEEGMFECQMAFNWTFSDGYSESKDAFVNNSINNTHPLYFDLYLQDTNELIYSSPVLPVGAQLTNIKLDTPLAAGTYKAVCMYNLLSDEETQDVISSAGFVVKIDVNE